MNGSLSIFLLNLLHFYPVCIHMLLLSFSECWLPSPHYEQIFKG